MSKGKRNVAFANDEDFDIEYVSRESTVQNKDAQPQKEIAIEPLESLEEQSARRTSRQEAVKGELNNFAKQSPEAVAAIIKGWFREDN